MAVLGILAIAGVGVSALRPDLVPAWARLRPAVAAADSGPYCEEHGVPEKFCTLCHPELKDKLLLCPEHGNIPEDICTLCHKDVQKKYNIKMCPKGHGLPEHFCIKCGKWSIRRGGQPDRRRLLCRRSANPSGRTESRNSASSCPLVRLASADLGRDIGLQTAPATEVEHTHELIANAETAYDANRYAEIFPRVAGFLREARVDLGTKGQSR